MIGIGLSFSAGFFFGSAARSAKLADKTATASSVK
jgi:hypothetical protein